jgi:hypothetical protein
MIICNSYEEINKKYPIDGKSNITFTVSRGYTNVMTEKDVALAKEENPHGYHDKIDHKWVHWNILSDLWYDSYIFDGEKWYLGTDSWDGIYPATMPDYGVHRAQTIFGSEYGCFQTIEEAGEYRAKKLRERLEF